MSLRKTLYQHCKNNHFEDLSCIVQFAIVNYMSSDKSQSEWTHISPEILNSYIGIGEDKIINLLEDLSNHSEAIERSYKFYCPDNEYEYCDVKEHSEIEDDEIELHCNSCDSIHTILNISECQHEIEYIGNKDKVIEELKIVNSDIAKEIVILNTNEEHIDKLANIIVSRLSVDKKDQENTKSGIIKILQSVKDVSGLIAGISGDVADTSNSVKSIIEDFSGISILKEFLITPPDIDTP